MDSYSRKAKAFDSAYKQQMEAADMARRSSEEAEADYGDSVRQANHTQIQGAGARDS